MLISPIFKFDYAFCSGLYVIIILFVLFPSDVLISGFKSHYYYILCRRKLYRYITVKVENNLVTYW